MKVGIIVLEAEEVLEETLEVISETVTGQTDLEEEMISMIATSHTTTT
jgi:hypothetical protein